MRDGGVKLNAASVNDVLGIGLAFTANRLLRKRHCTTCV